MIAGIVNFIGVGKVMWATLGSIWATSMAWAAVAGAQLAQIDGVTSGGSSALIPAAALTAMSGALVWVVKQFGSGAVVHRSVAETEAKNAEALDRMAAIAEAALRREERLDEILMAKRVSDG